MASLQLNYFWFFVYIYINTQLHYKEVVSNQVINLILLLVYFLRGLFQSLHLEISECWGKNLDENMIYVSFFVHIHENGFWGSMSVWMNVSPSDWNRDVLRRFTIRRFLQLIEILSIDSWSEKFIIRSCLWSENFPVSEVINYYEPGHRKRIFTALKYISFKEKSGVLPLVLHERLGELVIFYFVIWRSSS